MQRLDRLDPDHNNVYLNTDIITSKRIHVFFLIE